MLSYKGSDMASEEGWIGLLIEKSNEEFPGRSGGKTQLVVSLSDFMD
jgi:hypothetical protein